MISADRKQRILRVIKWTIIAAMCLPMSYVMSWLVLSREVNYGVVDPDLASWVRPVYRPLILYCDLRKPGAETLTDLWWTVSARRENGTQQRGWFLGPQYPMPGED